MKSTAVFRPLIAATALLCTTAIISGCAESNAQNADRFAAVEIKTDKLTDGVAVLFGAGGNIGVSHGEDGTLLIDDQYAPLSEKIQNAVAALGADKAKFVINTHWHGDHSGGNENFGNAGAMIIAHDNVRVRMLGEQTQGRGNNPASPKVALPSTTFADGVKLHMNGDEIHIIHIPTGHTDGDSIVFFKKANVIHMGDTYFNQVTLPFIDLNSGGNAKGILASAEKALSLADDDTQIIPGHGPMAGKADLQAYRDMMASVISRVQAGIDAGQTLEELQAQDLLKDIDVNKDGFIKQDAFIGFVYESLKTA
jgi:glyoxylase-like metal-dependent hydrolase (beta-lactamase superfamily II)